MKMIYTSPNGRLRFEIEVASGKQAFEVVSAIQELFEEPTCGCCGKANIRCAAREHDEYKFYNLVCGDCGAQLDFGQKKDGKTLFVKRRDKEGHVMPNRGWYLYQKKGDSYEAPSGGVSGKCQRATATRGRDSLLILDGY